MAHLGKERLAHGGLEVEVALGLVGAKRNGGWCANAITCTGGEGRRRRRAGVIITVVAARTAERAHRAELGVEPRVLLVGRRTRERAVMRERGVGGGRAAVDRRRGGALARARQPPVILARRVERRVDDDASAAAHPEGRAVAAEPLAVAGERRRSVGRLPTSWFPHTHTVAIAGSTRANTRAKSARCAARARGRGARPGGHRVREVAAHDDEPRPRRERVDRRDRALGHRDLLVPAAALAEHAELRVGQLHERPLAAPRALGAAVGRAARERGSLPARVVPARVGSSVGSSSSSGEPARARAATLGPVGSPVGSPSATRKRIRPPPPSRDHETVSSHATARTHVSVLIGHLRTRDRAVLAFDRPR